MAQPARMRKTRRPARRLNDLRCRWTHIFLSLLTGLVLSRAAFVSPIARRAVGTGPEKDVKDVEVMPVLSPEATVEIIGENTSAPVRLLYSPGGLVSKAVSVTLVFYDLSWGQVGKQASASIPSKSALDVDAP